MTCGICNQKGHNRRTCKNINTIQQLDDFKIDTQYHSNKQEACIICFNIPKYITITPCKHIFCSKCIFKNISFGNFDCPLCRKILVTPKKFFKKRHRLEIEQLRYQVKTLTHTLNRIQRNNNLYR